MQQNKMLRRSLVGGAALLILAFGGYLIVRRGAFHNYILAKVIRAVDESSGGRTQIGGMRLEWSGLRVHFYNVVVHGAESEDAAPLLQIEHLGLGLKIVSVLRRKIDFNSVVLDHALLHLTINAQGQSNLPTPKVRNEPSANVFDMNVGHLQLNGGEVFYDDRRAALDADMRAVQFLADRDSLSERYRGFLRYDQGTVRISGAEALPHALAAGFTADRAGVTIESATLTSGKSAVQARITLNNYAAPEVGATYQAVIYTPDLQPLAAGASLPTANIIADGTLRYVAAANQSVLDSIHAQGSLRIPDATVQISQATTRVSNLRAQYRLLGGNLELRDVQADMLGGSVHASLDARHISRSPAFTLTATGTGISAASVQNAYRGHRAVRVTGLLDAKVAATWQGKLEALTAQGDATFKGQVAGSNSMRSTPVPIRAVVHVRHDGTTGILTLTQSSVRTTSSELLAAGTMSARSNLNIQMRSTDLQELDAILLAIRDTKSPSGAPPQSLGLAGSARFDGRIQGSVARPSISGQLSATNFKVRGNRWRTLSVGLEANSTAIALHRGELQAMEEGTVKFDGNANLRDWAYDASAPIRLDATASALAVADVEQLAGYRYPISGALSFSAAIRGTSQAPTGQGSLQLIRARLWTEPVQNLRLTFQGSDADIRIAGIAVLPAGSATLDLAYSPKTEDYTAKVTAGGMKLDQLETLRARNLAVTGSLTVEAQGHGNLRSPELRATATIPQLNFRDQVFSNISAQVDLAQHRANLKLSSGTGAGTLSAQGSVLLNQDYDAELAFDLRGVPLQTLATAYLSRAASFQGHVDTHGTLKGPLKDPRRVQAAIEIPTVRATYQSLELSNSNPIRITYGNGIITVDPTELKGTGTDIRIQGSVPLVAGAAMQGSAQGSLNLQLLTALYQGAESSGTITANISARGTREHPEIGGDVGISEARFYSPTVPIGVEKVNGRLVVDANRVQVSQLTGIAGGGNFNVQGSVSYRPGIEFNIGLDANAVRLRYPEGLRTLLDAKLALNGTPNASALTGRVMVDRLSVTNDFDLAKFTTQFGGDESSTPAATSFADSVQLNVAIQSSGNLALASSKVSFQGDADLRATGTAANPVIVGRANVTDGELFFLNNRYHIERANVVFSNPNRTQPTVNVLATTKVSQYNLSLNLVGSMDRLRASYISDPPLDPVDIINLLARGKTTAEAAASPSNLGANALLAQGLASQVSSRVEKLAGLSSLQIDPLIGGNNRNPSARVAIQERVTSNIIFTFATDVSSTQNELIQVEYQITPKWSANVVRDEKGNFSIEGRLRKNF